ncbi:MAG: hypothetical protein QMC02_05890, partial [Halioglobus sp.]
SQKYVSVDRLSIHPTSVMTLPHEHLSKKQLTLSTAHILCQYDCEEIVMLYCVIRFLYYQ